MTNYCSACDVYWWPYMCKPTKGACPECGGGTVKKQEAGSLDADHRYKAAVARKAEAEKAEQVYAKFERYYAERERAALQATHDEIAALPEVEYRDLPRGARPEAA